MTVPTRDGRREVAERLRDDNHGYGTEYDFFLHALGMSREGRGPCDWAKVHKRLADLIDPTCHDFGGEEGTNGEGYDFACSACGYVCDLAEPRFCPNCGARVVRDDD